MSRDFTATCLAIDNCITSIFASLCQYLVKLFAKSYKEYSWLQESARDFPGMKELAKMFEQAGFKE